MEFVVEDLTTTTASVPLALLDRPATEVPVWPVLFLSTYLLRTDIVRRGFKLSLSPISPSVWSLARTDERHFLATISSFEPRSLMLCKRSHFEPLRWHKIEFRPYFNYQKIFYLQQVRGRHVNNSYHIWHDYRTSTTSSGVRFDTLPRGRLCRAYFVYRLYFSVQTLRPTATESGTIGLTEQDKRRIV